jgi:hypothetical protein
VGIIFALEDKVEYRVPFCVFFLLFPWKMKFKVVVLFRYLKAKEVRIFRFRSLNLKPKPLSLKP